MLTPQREQWIRTILTTAHPPDHCSVCEVLDLLRDVLHELDNERQGRRSLQLELEDKQQHMYQLQIDARLLHELRGRIDAELLRDRKWAATLQARGAELQAEVIVGLVKRVGEVLDASG